jgi:hypothetical protein
MGSERQTLVSRRAAFKPIAAAALASAAVIPAVAAQSSELASLIEAHRVALRTFEEWCTKEDETEKNAPDYLAVKDEWDRWNEAETASILALCAYVPRSPQEGFAKAEYLAQRHAATKGWDWDERHVEALLESIAGGQLYDN